MYSTRLPNGLSLIFRRMASSTQQTGVWADSGRWRRTEKPRALQSMGSQRVEQDLATEPQFIRGTRTPWKIFKILGIIFLSEIGKRKYHHIDIAYMSRLFFFLTSEQKCISFDFKFIIQLLICVQLCGRTDCSIQTGLSRTLLQDNSFVIHIKSNKYNFIIFLYLYYFSTWPIKSRKTIGKWWLNKLNEISWHPQSILVSWVDSLLWEFQVLFSGTYLVREVA